ncbi:MAG: hypothetical protein J7K66_07370 [Anaerolineaceae bacterium]|nr:hypothetical protein [Anaerolineaceae bacterium]
MPMLKFHPLIKKLLVIFVALSFSIPLFSCGANQPNSEEPQEAALLTATPIPTIAPDRVVLVASASTSTNELTEAQSLIAELAAGSGLEYETRQEIFANEITPDIRIVIFLEQPENLGSLAANAPATQFVAISDQNWSPPTNGTIIFKDKGQIAFLAGYLSALVAPNFRVGGLQISEDVEFNQAFNNGVSYYCGLCAAVVYPLNTYPVFAQQPMNSSPAAWQSAFNEINANKVNVLFLPGEAASAELGTYLAGMDVAIIGNQTPPEELRPKWAATISFDGLSPLREIWNNLLEGQGGKVVNASFKISDVNYVRISDGLVGLSQGKTDLLNKVITLLRNDRIYPYSIIQ